MTWALRAQYTRQSILQQCHPACIHSQLIDLHSYNLLSIHGFMQNKRMLRLRDKLSLYFSKEKCLLLFKKFLQLLLIKISKTIRDTLSPSIPNDTSLRVHRGDTELPSSSGSWKACVHDLALD